MPEKQLASSINVIEKSLRSKLQMSPKPLFETTKNSEDFQRRSLTDSF